jgi:predicted ATP-grasp superfamily ATP-dependent carboligase
MPADQKQRLLLETPSVKTAERPASYSVQCSNPSGVQLQIAGARVLISDEHYKHTLGIVRHLGKKGLHIDVVANSKNSLVCRSRFCREVIPSPGASVEALTDTLLRAVRRTRYDIVLPVSYPITLALATRQKEFAAFTCVEIAAKEAIELAANKVKITALAINCDVPVPRTITSAEFEKRSSELTFPVVIKPQKETPGRPPVRYARSAEQLSFMLQANRPDPPTDQRDHLLIQEFIPGFGCGFFATYQKGICKRVFMHRRVREYPASGGVSSCAESFYDAKLEAYGRRMLDTLEWHGVAMVEFRRDSRDGEYKLIEINPKFWGSLDLALAAGADFPGDLCRMALGQTLAFTDEYNRRLRFQWPLSGHGDMFHLWTRPQSIFSVVRDFLDPRVESNLWLSDPAPNAKEFLNLSGKLLRPHKR